MLEAAAPAPRRTRAIAGRSGPSYGGRAIIPPGPPRSCGTRHSRPAGEAGWDEDLGGGQAAGGDERLGGLGGERQHRTAGGAPLEAQRTLNGHDQLEIQRVACIACDDVPGDAPAQQRQVADEVEHLVAHELVAIAQAVEGGTLADDDRVVERAAERATALAQEAEIFQE